MRYFAYCRKSTESEDRQTQSIESQRQELVAYAQKEELTIVRFFEEAKSAKQPGRPIFRQMMDALSRGEADGIVAWHPDRLARNSVDGGEIIYWLDTGKIKDLAFPTAQFDNSPQGRFMLAISFGQSKYYVDNLSQNVRRGCRTKASKGWRPTGVPVGYLNDPVTKETVADPERFALVRRLWDDLLAGDSISDIHARARDVYGLRTRKRRRLGGGPLSLGTVYKIFGNPFYMGVFTWEGKQHQGKHPAMVTRSEFARAREVIGRKGKPQPHRHAFTYRGLIRCGACGSAVTCERTRNPYGMEYIYYHCTWKNVSPRCRERSIEERQVDSQFLSFLKALSLTESLRQWGSLALRKFADKERDGRTLEIRAQEKARAATEAQLSRLTDLHIRGMIDEDEFAKKRNPLLITREALAARQDRGSVAQEFELLIATFWLRSRAVSLFEKGDEATKRLLIQLVSSNILLKSKMLRIEAAKPLTLDLKSRSLSTVCTSLEAVRTFLRSEEGRKFHSQLKELHRLAQ